MELKQDIQEKRIWQWYDSDVPCKVAGTFTSNVVKAAPVKYDQNVVDN